MGDAQKSSSTKHCELLVGALRHIERSRSRRLKVARLRSTRRPMVRLTTRSSWMPASLALLRRRSSRSDHRMSCPRRSGTHEACTRVVLGEFGVPFLYSTNGEVIWHHDVRHDRNRSRQIAHFHTPDALREQLGRELALRRMRSCPCHRRMHACDHTRERRARPSRKRWLHANGTCSWRWQPGPGKTFTHCQRDLSADEKWCGASRACSSSTAGRCSTGRTRVRVVSTLKPVSSSTRSTRCTASASKKTT